MFSWEDLGEKTLSKIAKLAISSQIKYAKELEVEVKTNPSLLAKGALESLIIEAKEIQVTESLLLDEMRIVLNKIEVNPFKALMGNIQLNYPSEGISYFSISQNSLLQDFKDYPLRESISSCSLYQHEYLERLEVKSHQFTLSSGKIFLKSEFLLDQKIHLFELLLEPYVNSEEEVSLKIIECLQGKEYVPIISDLFLEYLVSIFNLTDLRIDGLSFKTNQIIVKEGLVALEAKTQLTYFRSTK